MRFPRSSRSANSSNSFSSTSILASVLSVNTLGAGRRQQSDDIILLRQSFSPLFRATRLIHTLILSITCDYPLDLDLQAIFQARAV
ncbi:uncharacterized protein PHALS_03483 [Plasmopara halstedii]|uniref:Uncharacterized protein n=1 Tax=Plasmopara halstedii TaxID=4781 RepID=A0A0N7L7D9_PLAHL|nr:uncharacterized protein PHALS_03483 [Plasmopara halstedii]CEG46803.1 hypothetical protein PHALS_03483 [Plasmopara halstedii]|eukprot:XP_024583172.1 hypothetical protein PHALS_03483 [Plasmopara halstedii]